MQLIVLPDTTSIPIAECDRLYGLPFLPDVPTDEKRVTEHGRTAWPTEWHLGWQV